MIRRNSLALVLLALASLHASADIPLDIGDGSSFNAIYVVGIPRDRLQALGGKPQPGWFPEVDESRPGSHRGPPLRVSASGRSADLLDGGPPSPLHP